MDGKDDKTKLKNAKKACCIIRLKSEYNNMKFLKQPDINAINHN